MRSLFKNTAHSSKLTCHGSLLEVKRKGEDGQKDLDCRAADVLPIHFASAQRQWEQRHARSSVASLKHILYTMLALGYFSRVQNPSCSLTLPP